MFMTANLKNLNIQHISEHLHYFNINLNQIFVQEILGRKMFNSNYQE